MTTDKLIRVIMALVVAYLLFHLGRFASDFIAHGFFHVPPHIHRWLSLGIGIGAVLLFWEPAYQKLLTLWRKI